MAPGDLSFSCSCHPMRAPSDKGGCQSTMHPLLSNGVVICNVVAHQQCRCLQRHLHCCWAKLVYAAGGLRLAEASIIVPVFCWAELLAEEAGIQFTAISPAAPATSAVAVLYALCEAAVGHLKAHALCCDKRGCLQATEVY